MATREEIVKQAQAWLGRKEADGTHREIIDIYNSHKPLARGYKVTYIDAWCAAFVSAVAIKCGATDIIPTECGCGSQIELFKRLGSWQEDDSYTPAAGDVIYYDWDDSGAGDNKGGSEHTGIVEKVVGNTITIIEGNYKDAVTRRYICINDRFIRGYGVPKYSTENTATTNKELATVEQNLIRKWQLAAIADGFKFPKYGADGEWGAECEAVAKQAVVKRRATYKYNNLTKLVQQIVGAEVDGKCGSKTDAAIKAYQRKNGLAADGAVGINTWRKMLT